MPHIYNKQENLKNKISGHEISACITPGAVIVENTILSSKQRNEVIKITRRLKNSLNF